MAKLLTVQDVADKLLTVQDVADRLQLKREAARKLIRARMDYVVLNEGGKHENIRVAENELLKYIRKATTNAEEREQQKAEASTPTKRRRTRTPLPLDFTRIPTWEEAQRMAPPKSPPAC